MVSSASQSNASGAPFAGIGVGHALTDQIELRAQFQGPNLVFIGSGVLSAGVSFRFCNLPDPSGPPRMAL